MLRGTVARFPRGGGRPRRIQTSALAHQQQQGNQPQKAPQQSPYNQTQYPESFRGVKRLVEDKFPPKRYEGSIYAAKEPEKLGPWGKFKNGMSEKTRGYLDIDVNVCVFHFLFFILIMS